MRRTVSGSKRSIRKSFNMRGIHQGNEGLAEALEPRQMLANIGEFWQRSVDWTAQANPDSTGQPSGGTWQYESVPLVTTTNNGGLGQNNPWYAQIASTPDGTIDKLCVWDANWAGGATSGWVYANDIGPIESQNLISHSLLSARVPVIRWMNTIGHAVTVGMSGSLAFSFNEGSGGTLDQPVEFIMMLQKSDGTTTPIIIDSRKATDTNLNIYTNKSAIEVPAGASIFYTFRYKTNATRSGWITLNDQNLQFTLKSNVARAIPAADTAYTTKGLRLNVEVLANDAWDARTVPTVTIVSGPTNGIATVRADQSIDYIPNTTFTGTDTLTYQVGNSVFAQSTATLVVRQPAYLYVKPTGNDGNSGADWNNALASLNGARIKVSALRTQNPNQAVEVIFDDGMYSSTNPQTVQFGATDSGSAEYPVIYRAKTALDTYRYLPGFNWNPRDDWTNGPVAGSPLGNPDNDSKGNPAWAYRYTLTGGGNLASATPWYKNTVADMVWDSQWHSTGTPAWVVSDNQGGMAQSTALTHNLSGTQIGHVPELVWTNPSGQNLTLSIAGTLDLYIGSVSATAEADADVVLAKRSGNGWTNLFTTSVHLVKGTTQHPVISLSNVKIAPGEQIVLSVRGENNTVDWVTLSNDLDFTVTNAEPARIYTSGDSWNPKTDWTGGTTPGSPLGNPDNDSKGNAAWSYRYTPNGGQDLASGTPWYKNTSADMVWDDQWYTLGVPAWVVSDNQGGMALQGSLTHNLSSTQVDRIPELVWTNPSGQNLTLSIYGKLDLSVGTVSPTAEADADVVLARRSGGTWTSLYTTTVHLVKGTTQYPTISLTGVAIAPGDQLVLSVRGKNNTTDWITLSDDLTLTVTSPLPTASISGGKTLNNTALNWQPVQGKPDTYSANLYTSGQLTPTQIDALNSLFVNGKRAVRAREPDVGFYTIISTDPDTSHADNKTNSFIFGDTDISGYGDTTLGNGQQDILSTWTNLTDVEIVSYATWTESRMPIASVDAANSKVRIQGTLVKSWSSDYLADYGMNKTTGAGNGTTRYYIENVFEGLDQPGEWYLNTGTNVLYYHLRPGESISTSTFVAPTVNELVRMTGTSNVRFDGLTFRDTDWTMPAAGQEGAQSAAFSATTGAIFMDGTSNISLQNGRVANTGYYGVQMALNPSTVASTVLDMEFVNNGGGGVMVNVNPNFDNDKLSAAGNHRISLNEIHDNNDVWREATGIFLGRSGNNRIMGNHVYNGAYCGIGFGWFDQQFDAAGHNFVYRNTVHDNMRLLYDGAGIYLLGSQPDTRVMDNTIGNVRYTSNHLHRLTSTDTSAGSGGGPLAGVYTDESSAYTLIMGNTINDVNYGLFTNASRGMMYDSNIIVDAQHAPFFMNYSSTKTMMGPNWWTSNLATWTKTTTLPVSLMAGGVWTGNAPFTFNKNIYRYGPVTINNPNGTLSRIQTTNIGGGTHDNNALVTTIDLFVDWFAKDYRIRLDAQDDLLAQGFAADWLFE